jgi:hypothetical protein
MQFNKFKYKKKNKFNHNKIEREDWWSKDKKLEKKNSNKDVRC